MSLKDNFYVESVDTTVGFVAWANDPATPEQESVMTRIMREQGALLFCKTYVNDCSIEHEADLFQQRTHGDDDARVVQQRLGIHQQPVQPECEQRWLVWRRECSAGPQR